MQKIKIGIVGFGNLGKAVYKCINNHTDMELISVISRRNLYDIPFTHIDHILNLRNKVDVMILCGGSATDLPLQTPEISKYFNVVDSYDNHKNISEHYNIVNDICINNNKTAVISAGWDPGIFSINRLYSECILPQGSTHTFWGSGISQGHSDAIRRIDGVIDARQYTVPIDKSVDSIRGGCDKNINFTDRQMHKRICYVVADSNANKDIVRDKIINMPAYFEPYDTQVNFISSEELAKNHSGLPHGGTVIRSGYTDDETNHKIEYSLKLDSNPDFTANILLAYARSVSKLSIKNHFGAKTVFDIPPYLLSEKSRNDLIKELL